MITNRALSVQRGDVRCLSDGLPADDDLLSAGTDVAHLCDNPSSDLARRAVLTALYAFDAAVGWSTREDWRRLNGWWVSITSAWRPSAENVAPRPSSTPG